MILTLTPNPSLDRTMEVDALHRGATQRARSVHVHPGGKGVNVSRALVAHGHKTRAVMPCGGPEGDRIARLLRAEGIELVPVEVDAPVRVNLTVVERDGTTTKLNAAGGPLSTADTRALADRAVEAAAAGGREPTWVACCGSLPAGVDDAFYARLVLRLRATGAGVAIDTNGAPLAAVADSGADLLKPNAEELAEVSGAPLDNLGDVVDAALALCRRGTGAVLVSLGAQGAVLVDGREAVSGRAPPAAVRSTVGAGDALLAGFLSVPGGGPPALAEGLAWGTATCGLSGTRMPSPGDVDRSQVHLDDEVPAGRPLTEPSTAEGART